MITLMAGAWAGSGGLAAGPVAFKGPARHDLRPAFSAWGRGELGPVGLTGEVSSFWRFRQAVEHRLIVGRLSVAAGVGTGSDRVHVGIAIGPALVVRAGSAGDYAFTRFDPAVRMVSHFDLRLGRTPVALRYQLGSVTRGLRAWDFDASAGVGVWW